MGEPGIEHVVHGIVFPVCSDGFAGQPARYVSSDQQWRMIIIGSRDQGHDMKRQKFN
jgi:hypothetical protein